MGKYIAESCVKSLIAQDKPVMGARIGILGFTFKENCPDTRNTKVIDIYNELREYGIDPIVIDPQADSDEAKRLYGITFDDMSELHDMDAVIVAVAHEDFLGFDIDEMKSWFAKEHKTRVFLDVKGIFDMKKFSRSEFAYWRL